MEEEKKKKPIYKKVWFWIVLVIIVIAISGSSDEQTSNITTNSISEVEKNTIQNDVILSENDNLTLGQKNALNQAKSYLKISAFSYKGLVEQLEFEGYSTEEATYAVDNCGADWNEQASKKAKDYIDMTSFSKTGLIEQLEFEGFTSEQAEYGATSIGY